VSIITGQEKTESVHFVFQGNTTNKKRKKSKTKGRNTNTTASADPTVAKVQEKKSMVIACFFCKKVGHIKQNCIKYQKWLIKKSMSHAYVCS